MGASLSYLVVQGPTPQEVLRRLGLEVRDPVPAPHAWHDLNGAELPGGWYLVLGGDDVTERVVDRVLAPLSAGCTVLAVMAFEGTMYSLAVQYRDGRQIWQLEHSPDSGVTHLDVTGSAPAELAGVHGEALRRQAAERDDVDHVFDVPATVAAAICGYHWDRDQLPTGRPGYVALGSP